VCQRKVPLDRTGYSELTRLRYCRTAASGEFDHCLFLSCLRLHVDRDVAFEVASRPLLAGVQDLLFAASWLEAERNRS
jgi:hypothetical protein